ncbi:WD domain, G-beta repeat protein (macronuclear) [Tetrahymena thermophila SB210]|uniref:WD domain, G-beta repeat protein n=1 Tax=Tetrahymena thermophila (strain SB210) TaxID=312017 RepID=I7M4H5_TETTS|nr:WD domain, G-beta repeat protein [Tetrahymena thermophila SB210]EAS07055.1 WD domain, G-beta repeat protein [Tetrahymena thermophila SB210]|eukprot:XP_001027297.1 WD domain, G-beta repeat protein [Tetrahymena thermophila SB210]
MKEKISPSRKDKGYQEEHLITVEATNLYLVKDKKQVISKSCSENMQSIINKSQTQSMYFHQKNEKQLLIGLSQIQRQKIANLLKKSDSKMTQIQFQKIFKSQNSSNQERILGGGACCSRSDGQNELQFQLIDEQVNQNNQIDHKFNKFYQDRVNNVKYVNKIIEKQEYTTEISDIFDKCINRTKENIVVNVNMYRIFMIEFFNLCLQYTMGGSLAIDRDDQNQIISKIDVFLSNLQQNSKLFPCSDLEFIYQFLYDLSDQDIDISEKNASQLELISQFVKLNIENQGKFQKKVLVDKSMKINDKDGQEISQLLYDIAFKRSEQLEQIWQIVDRAQEKVRSFTKDTMIKYFAAILAKRAKHLENIEFVKAIDDLVFYIEEFINCSDNQTSSHLVLYLLIQINYILEKNILDFKFVEDLNQQFNVNDKFQQFYKMIKQQSAKKQSTSESFLLFFKFSVKDVTYRFVSNQILLKLYDAFQSDSSEEKNTLFTHLVFTYVSEKNDSIKLIYQSNNKFVSVLNEEVKSNPTNMAQSVITYQKSRLEEFENNKISKKELEQIEDTIKDQSDFFEKLSLKIIEKWEIEARQRLEKDIAQKDDILLEVQDLYIDQNIAFMSGNNIFADNIQQNQNIKINAIDSIIQSFLMPHQLDQPQKQNNQAQTNCKILGILAEGGVGKSMLFKRLETLVMKEKNSNKQKDGKQINYITFLIKCNSLNPENPSLDEYLLSQKLEQHQIDQIKKLSKNKLILLDGYDEFSGDFFRIYSKLKLNEWQNTLVIVSSRMEKLSENDARHYFSLDDKHNVRDETSYCIAKLKEFERKDIDQYCKKFYTKQSSSSQTSLSEEQFIGMMGKCLSNQQLETLLFLPINLYLFTRLVVNKEEKELNDLIKNISDQIQIQEIFFNEQFSREAIDFMTQIQQSLSDKKLKTEIVTSFFVYFQTIAMQMFLNKGKRANFLQLNKEEVSFNLQQSLKSSLKNENQQKLLIKITNYVNSKIATKVKSNENPEGQKLFNNTIEFKHKSLFEYFAARAMKYDFDVHGDKVHSLSIEELAKFAINQKIIMTPEENQSEQQILLKLYKLIKQDIESQQFIATYSSQQISQTSRYIQYLRKSTITNQKEKSKIDIGASNMLSVLLNGKFAYEELSFSKCSFSKAYIPGHKSLKMNFDYCNLDEAYLDNQNLGSFESSYTNNAMLKSFKKLFDLSDVYISNDLMYHENEIITVNQNGFINRFDFKNKKLVQSKKISCYSLKKVYQYQNQFFVSCAKTIFEIDKTTFEILNSFQFTTKIVDIQFKKGIFLVQLDNKTTQYGNLQNGFKEIKVDGDNLLLTSLSVIALKNEQMNVYETKNFKLIQQTKCEKYKCSSANEDGNLIALIFENKIQLWTKQNDEYKLFKETETQKKAEDGNMAVLSPNGKYLAILKTSQTLQLYKIDQEIKEDTFLISIHMNSFTFSNDSNYFGACSSDFTFYNINLSTENKQVEHFQGHVKMLNNILYSPDDKYVISVSKDTSCIVWDRQNNYQLVKIIKAYTYDEDLVDFNMCAAFSMDGSLFVTGCQDKKLRIYDVKKGYESINQITLPEDIFGLSFSYDQMYLAVVSNSGLDQTLTVFDVKQNFKQIQKFTSQLRQQMLQTAHKRIEVLLGPARVAFSPDNKYLISTIFDNYFKIYDVKNQFKFIKEINAHDNFISSIAFSPDNKYFVTGSTDGNTKIWMVEQDFKLLKVIELDSFEGQITSLAFSKNNKYFANVCFERYCQIWDVEKQFGLINTISKERLSCVNFSQDSKYLTTGGSLGTFQVWDISQRFEEIAQNKTQNTVIYRTIFSPGSKYLATICINNVCKIWNVENGFEHVYTINIHKDETPFIAFTENLKLLGISINRSTIQINDIEKNFQPVHQIKCDEKQVSWQILLFVFQVYNRQIQQSKNKNVFDKADIDEALKFTEPYQKQDTIAEFQHNQKYFFIRYKNGQSKVFSNENNFALLKEFQNSENKICQTRLLSKNNNDILILSYTDSSFEIMDIKKNFEVVKKIQLNEDDSMDYMSFTNNFNYLITNEVQKALNFWSIENGYNLICKIGFLGKNVTFSLSDDGKYLSVGDVKECKIYDAQKVLQHVANKQKNNKDQQDPNTVEILEQYQLFEV